MSITLIYKTNLRFICNSDTLRVLLASFLTIFYLMVQAQDNVVGSTYHNVTAHYNAYWLAKERIIEVENGIKDRYKWDFNRMLPVFAQYDTTVSKSFEQQLTECIEKASMAIQRHPGSKWEYDAYNIVGYARLYGSEFPEGIETFKYVNTRADEIEDRNRALIGLMRTFIEASEIDNARSVSDYLKKNKMDDEARKQLELTRGYFYQKINQLPEMAASLAIAESLMNGDPDHARIAFILGQVYQSLGVDSAAYYYYKRAIKHSKTYELSFYSRLNMSQVAQANTSASNREVKRYFKKLLKDPKNDEYKGRIYYELAGFNYKTGDLKNAIAEYKNSIKVNKNDNRLKAYTYLKLADIYYEDLKDFSLAKAYYDSTMTNYPKNEPGYLEMSKRASVLEEFVRYYNTIQVNDSLLTLSTIPMDSIGIWLDYLVSEQESKAIAKAELEAKEKRRSAIVATSTAQTNDLLRDINENSSGTWYFYNSTELSKGYSSFKSKWGQRALEDNWRRSLKTTGSLEGTTNSTAQASVQQSKKTQSEQESEVEKPVFDREGEKAKLLATIPFEDDEKRNLLAEIEVALYELGKIYNFKLEEKENAIISFESFIDRFDESKYLPEVLYQLYLLYKPIDSLMMSTYFNKLIMQHDTSIYAKLAINPNYINERDQENEDYKKIYVKAYHLYETRQAKLSQQLVDSALSSKPSNEYVDNLALLQAMNLGQLEGIYKYQFELNNFIRDYKESDLVPYAEALLKRSQEFQINLYSSSKAKYIRNFDTNHYFILVYPFKEELTDPVSDELQQYIKKIGYQLSTGNIVLDETHALVLVNEFANKTEAQSFLNRFKKEEQISSKFAPERFYPMVITNENFQIFYETKDLDSYFTFFDKNYAK